MDFLTVLDFDPLRLRHEDKSQIWDHVWPGTAAGMDEEFNAASWVAGLVAVAHLTAWGHGPT